MPNHYQKAHSWLKKLKVAYHPNHQDGILDEVAAGLLDAFSGAGHRIQQGPTSSTDLLLTTAAFGDPLDWRKALIFTARRQFNLDQNPTVLTMVHLTPDEFYRLLNRLEKALEKEEPDPMDFDFSGLSKNAPQVIYEQGQRGGSLLALERIIQAQVKCIEVLLVVGEAKPEQAFTFNLVGAHPRMDAEDPVSFYREIMLRMVTMLSTSEITDHKSVDGEIPREVWQNLDAVQAMKRASRQFGKRDFFTRTIRIEDLVHVPAVSDVVSSQYSEGCFATWEPEINGLIITVTGSARLVKKDNIEEADLAVIVGVREDGEGALVRHVEGKQKDPPSSEAVELIDMDAPLPRIKLDGKNVPVVRSKLHGHRSVAGFNPVLVEHVPLNLPYYYFPVSCATKAQAEGIKKAFSYSKALQNPGDPRQIVFTVLPGHGVVIAEKWVRGKDPFQVIWEAMDAGDLRIDSHIPQGMHTYSNKGDICILEEDSLVVPLK
jgi:hypothetical protein